MGVDQYLPPEPAPIPSGLGRNLASSGRRRQPGAWQQGSRHPTYLPHQSLWPGGRRKFFNDFSRACGGAHVLQSVDPESARTVKGADYVDSLDGFYKDLSIMGGFLLLYITGAGKYSIDALLGIAAP